ncbi:spermidine/putrescine ABC transporter substrate-binding protein [Catellatospora sp. KI3]|uniref:ABC transporter substrate-binding protein n=1 Tax=Catellatospora sp. KI3 TaxID=3041620 RepID=UPI002482DF02|nr:spermidine/putrescine ABC transporter substrate-binding protein [Catellatospora sp. KI3]MDI1460488.1 spermidine/putrescine ABC transporter substrate-binding protein [Catellatospora sp. KI3]
MRAPGTLSSPARALLQAVGRPITRRRVLGAALAGGAVAAGAATLGGCGLEGTGVATASCAAADRSAAERRVDFSNWVQYVDVDEQDPDRRPTLAAFTARTGIKVDYTEDINDNNEFFGKIRPQLAGCQDIERDLVVFTDWMAAKFIRQGLAQPVDPARIPAVHRNVLPSLKLRSYDRELAYSIPWQSGLTGFAVNTRVASEVHTVDELLTRPDLKGRVTVPMEMSDTMALLIASLCKDPADFTPEDFDAALDKLARAVQTGHIRRFSGNEYVQDLAKGDVAAAIAWSGDALQLNAADEKVKFIAPDEGLLIWSDCALIPSTARHGANAAKLLDHYYDPGVAAELAAWVNYVCPVVGAQEEMLKIDPELAENELIFPSASMLGRVRAFKSLSAAEERAYQAKFSAVMGT